MAGSYQTDCPWGRHVDPTDPLSTIEQAVSENVPQQERSAVQALIVEELRRLHEGVLARYGLRPSEFIAWKAQHGR